MKSSRNIKKEFLGNGSVYGYNQIDNFYFSEIRINIQSIFFLILRPDML